jgi:hypothetical protein
MRSAAADPGRRSRYLAHALRAGCSAGACRLADVLDGFRERGQHAHPRQVVLARWLGVCTRTVRRWTVELEAADVLDVERFAARHHPATGRWTRRTNGYRCRFRRPLEKRMAPIGGNVQLTPRGHSCPHDGLSSTSRNRRPSRAGPPPGPPRPLPVAVVPITVCQECGERPPEPGKWRCAECQILADERRATRTERDAPRPPVVP